jgi:hypothetical protein
MAASPSTFSRMEIWFQEDTLVPWNSCVTYLFHLLKVLINWKCTAGAGKTVLAYIDLCSDDRDTY